MRCRSKSTATVIDTGNAYIMTLFRLPLVVDSPFSNGVTIARFLREINRQAAGIARAAAGI
jgi:hypothetical protein